MRPATGLLTVLTVPIVSGICAATTVTVHVESEITPPTGPGFGYVDWLDMTR